MFWPRIEYSVRPSDEDGSFCEFIPKGDNGTYTVHVQVRYAQRQILLSPELMSPLIHAIGDLRLPPLACGGGLDGTIYSLTIGTLNTVTYGWWESIPDEWPALQPIIAEIERLTDLRNEKSYLGL